MMGDPLQTDRVQNRTEGTRNRQAGSEEEPPLRRTKGAGGVGLSRGVARDPGGVRATPPQGTRRKTSSGGRDRGWY